MVGLGVAGSGTAGEVREGVGGSDVGGLMVVFAAGQALAGTGGGQGTVAGTVKGLALGFC